VESIQPEQAIMTETYVIARVSLALLATLLTVATGLVFQFGYVV
jgi:hypothetical protein